MYAKYGLLRVPGVREYNYTSCQPGFLVVRIVINNHKPTHSTTASDLSESADFPSMLLLCRAVTLRILNRF